MTHLEILSTLLNTTFGRESSRSGTRSITASFANNVLTLKYITIIKFADNNSVYAHTLNNQVGLVENESIQLIDEKIKILKDQYKELTGKNLKLKKIAEDSNSSNIELLPSTVHAPTRSAYFRRFFKFQIGD